MKVFRAGLCLALVAAACGCSRTGPSAKVTGAVTYNGQPVTAGEVIFLFEQGGQYTAAIKPDGTYQFMGLPEGGVVALVKTETFNPDKQSAGYIQTQKSKQIAAGVAKNYSEYDKMSGKNRPGHEGDAEVPAADLTKEQREQLARVYVKIPKKYADRRTSPLNFAVESGSQTKDLELTD